MRRLKAGGSGTFRAKTGLPSIPSGTKLRWPSTTCGPAAARGAAALGTIDTRLVEAEWARAHVTDFTNASRTLLFDIHKRRWDDELLRVLQLPDEILPRVVPSSGVAATTAAAVCGAEVPIAGIAGDQQAALFGQVCFVPGMVKNTYGTAASF